MWTIGIVDVTTVGSTICQRRISELGGTDYNHPEFAVHSLPFKIYREAILNRDWERMAQLIILSIEKLATLGAAFAIIPSNTPHYAYEIFSKTSPIPVVDLIELTAKACKRAGFKKVAILGTISTMMDGLYTKKIQEKGMTLVIPGAEAGNAINTFIMEEIIPGRVTEKSRQEVLELIKNIECDGFILGCTELPEVYTSTDLGKPAIDTTRLLAEVAFDIAEHEQLDRGMR